MVTQEGAEAEVQLLFPHPRLRTPLQSPHSPPVGVLHQQQACSLGPHSCPLTCLPIWGAPQSTSLLPSGAGQQSAPLPPLVPTPVTWPSLISPTVSLTRVARPCCLLPWVLDSVSPAASWWQAVLMALHHCCPFENFPDPSSGQRHPSQCGQAGRSLDNWEAACLHQLLAMILYDDPGFLAHGRGASMQGAVCQVGLPGPPEPWCSSFYTWQWDSNGETEARKPGPSPVVPSHPGSDRGGAGGVTRGF